MELVKFIVGSNEKAAHILKEHIEKLDMDLSYARMMFNRVDGKVSDECVDTYYIAYEDNSLLTRLWNGWGKHKDAIGNFGNFLTVDEARGKGIGGKVLSMWYEDISSRTDLPLGLFCSAGSKELVSLYKKYGFNLAVRGTETGPLFKPLGNSPSSFVDFCKEYYVPSENLYVKSATVEYRHEVDCLLKFALMDNDLTFGFDEIHSIEEALVFENDYNTEILFTDLNRVAGWQITLPDGTIKKQVYPLYDCSVIKQ